MWFHVHGCVSAYVDSHAHARQEDVKATSSSCEMDRKAERV